MSEKPMKETYEESRKIIHEIMDKLFDIFEKGSSGNLDPMDDLQAQYDSIYESLPSVRIKHGLPEAAAEGLCRGVYTIIGFCVSEVLISEQLQNEKGA